MLHIILIKLLWEIAGVFTAIQFGALEWRFYHDIQGREICFIVQCTKFGLFEQNGSLYKCILLSHTFQERDSPSRNVENEGLGYPQSRNAAMRRREELPIPVHCYTAGLVLEMVLVRYC